MSTVPKTQKNLPPMTFGDYVARKNTASPPLPSSDTQKSRPTPTSSGSSRIMRICARCNKHIYQNSLKALGRYYHEECFVCYDCGTVCKPKYFPFEDPETHELIPLCQHDYFKRNNLLCFVCEKPLRGVYYNAFGKLYDEEHFCCKVCGAKCGMNTCFNHKDELYCKYHFLKFFSKRCKGCHYPISDQYIEFPRGDEIHRWHPECYGIHKYWHVSMPPAAAGLPPLPVVNIEKNQKAASQDTNPSPQELEKYVQSFNSIISKTWSVLYRFEEETASCISDMFQYLTSFDQSKGINSTALFVLKIECLFKALDCLQSVESYYTVPKERLLNRNSADGANISLLNDASSTSSNNHENNNTSYKGAKYSKFSRNLSTKVMIYLQLLRKLSTASKDKDVNISSLMSVITGLAHFLKLLVRCGLNDAVEYNKSVRTVNILVKFLREIEKNEHIVKNPFAHINVSINATDSCFSCGKYIQEECIQYQELRWHNKCFKCSTCGKHIQQYDVADAAFNKKMPGNVFCAHCSVDDPDSKPGFKLVTKLSQLVFLLKIALIRSKAVMEIQMKNRELRERSNSVKETISMQQTYIRTLNDIKRLKSRRQSVRMTHDKQEARRSRILETTETDINNTTAVTDRSLIIQTDHGRQLHQHTSENNNMFNNTKSLTLDDISRIVAAEQARELRPNAFTHFKKLKETDDVPNVVTKKSGVYYSELSAEELYKLQLISLSLLTSGETPLIKAYADAVKLLPDFPRDTAVSSNGFWGKFKTIMSKDSKKITYNKVFGTPLNYLSVKWGADSDLGIGPVKLRVPILLDEIISSLRQMDMSVEGVFRKNGNIRKLKELAISIDSNPSEVPDLSSENSIQLSALLKKFLRELPNPLLTFPLYDMWVQTAKIESDMEKHRFFSLLYSLLPYHHRNVAEVLFSFLYWASSFSHIDTQIGSKMDIHNLSTVITPNILYQMNSATPSPGVTSGAIHSTYNDAFAQNEGENYFLAIEAVDYLINHNEDLAMVPNYMIALLKDVKAQELDLFEDIRKYIVKRVQEGKVNFSEYDVKEPVQRKETTSVTKVDVSDSK